jgi:Flp pilus assembly protein TadG
MLRILNNQHGVSAIFVAVSLFAFFGCAAIAVDVFHFIVVKNELQNAADAGALSGASALYRDTLGVSVDPNANTDALAAATANESDWVAVEVFNPTANTCSGTSDRRDPAHEDIQRGHWSFANSSADYPVSQANFQCNNTLVAKDLSQYNYDQLNADTDFVNAVKVVTRRHGTPVLSFFSRIFGLPAPVMSAEAIAYIGFASINTEVGAPIVICRESIQNYGGDGPIACNEGRMFNANNDTARWSSFEDCDGNTNTSELISLIDQFCGGNNPLVTKPELSTMEGQSNVAFDDLINCWLTGVNQISTGEDNNGDGEDDTTNVSIDEDGDGIPDVPWQMVLPVIICEGDDAGGPTCGPVDGFVEIKVVWMAMKDSIDPVYDPNKPDEPGAPDYMHYGIPTYDGGVEYGDSWPSNWPPGYDGFYAGTTVDSPLEEYIYNTSMGDGEASIYDIMAQNLTEQELANLKNDILSDHPGWDLVNWEKSEGTPITFEDLKAYGEVRWASLVKHFKLKNKNGDSAVYVKKTIYFMPTCDTVESNGSAGFDNWGILAKYPKLVK